MLIYVDVFSGKEICTDIYKTETLYGGNILKVAAKLVKEVTEVSDSMFGGNKSAEGGDDEGADGAVATSGLNVVLANKLEETTFNKKSYQTHIKDYMKRLIAHVEKEGSQDISAVKKDLQEFVKSILSEFGEWQFWQAPDDDEGEGQIILCKWTGDDTADMYYFKHGLREEKC